METQSNLKWFGNFRPQVTKLAVMAACLFGAISVHAAQLTLKVWGVESDGTMTDITATADYRWTVEHDATKASIPGKPADLSNYSFSFHTSYMPVVAAGRAGTASTTAPTQDPDVLRLYGQQLPDLDPSKRYYVSVAAVGYQMGGAPVVFSGTGATATPAAATVYLNKYNLPTAQISVLAFNDNSPINGAPDLPQEQGLAGFTVKLMEAGGTYGQSGGEVTQDAFGNPLGTTYNADGSLKVRGSGIILTDANGVATIKNLFPAKYTIFINPPVGSDWHQTSTIEGTKGSDAWVKNNEPQFFQEFGPPGHHVFLGFTKSGALVPGALNGNSEVSGRIVNTHYSRPPVYTFHNGAPVPECWVGLNQTEANGGRALYATACKKDSTFSIPNVPAGTYSLVVWDEPLDMIIATTTITVGAGNLAMGDVPVASWFGRYQGRVFQDIDGTGLPYFAADFDRPYVYVNPVTGVEEERQQFFKAGDLKPPFGAGIANNIRFRDGSIYQSATTKDDGTFAFTEVFPFFNWMVAEIDYARFKATSMTAVVDGGGAIDPVGNKSKLWNAAPGSFGSNDPGLAYDPWTRLNPQLQADGTYFRTESVEGGPGAVLLEGMQLFLGQTNHIEWGKVPYTITENGGIAGIVYYGITRAEDDPRYATAENWEPGIPRVQINVFLDCDGDGIPDKPMNDGTGQCEAGAAGLSTQGYQHVKPDVDNYPFCWRDPESCGLTAGSKGPEDRARGGDGTTFSYGDVIRWGAPGITGSLLDQQNAQTFVGLGKTDSWDDSIPRGCPDPTPYSVPTTGEPLDCYDGLRNFNQLRPSVFDGGFAFGRVAGQAELPMIIGANAEGKYILEAVAPPGYLHQGNGDKNVVFGDSLKASPAALPHECVGAELDVPEFLTLFPGEGNPNFGSPQYPGNKWRKCDMKAVQLTPGLNAAPNFFMYTEAPVAAHAVGFILDDTAAEFNSFAPTFGEKFSPPHLPVSIQDWTGREISRVYSDQFGSYNFLAPSSFTVNPPYPSGVMPNMMVACMNHAGPIEDTRQFLADGTTVNPTFGQKIIDPYFNRGYTQFCYTFQYLAGKTTYLDTPVLPVAAFAAVDKNPLDCECADGTPTIYSVTNGDNGPWVPGAGTQLTIVSVGKLDVANPAFDPAVVTSPKTIQRDYGFGLNSGSVTLGGMPLTIDSWSDGIIKATIPTGASTGQLMIKRAGATGKESVVGLTVHVGGPAPMKVNPNATAGSGVHKTIQAAIDSVTDVNMLLNGGALITVAPGTYSEYVILDKRVRLQGWGAGSVTINAAKSSAAGLATWRAKVNAKANNTFTLLPGQTLGFDPTNNEPLLFGAEEGPGILVVGRQGIPALGSNCLFGNTAALRIDGLTITGADSGGGILASGYACDLIVSNNRILGNYGTYGGGIRIGHTTLTNTVGGANTFTDAVNPNPSVHHNWISQNGATAAGGGGGVTLGTGSNSYTVADNYVCGNFSMADGGGLSHVGRSTGSVGANGIVASANLIARNKFVFNQTFNQGADPMGGGLSIAGQLPLVGGTPVGTGDVVVDANLIQGNQAGAGAGGGVSIARTVSTDDIDLTNNMIVNNVTAYTGGGVALTSTTASATAGVRLVNNTVASNVSTATNKQAFGTNTPQQGSQPQTAGVSVLSGDSPTMLNNVIWANRSLIYFISGTSSGLYDPDSTISPAGVITPVDNPQYRDLGRVGAGATLIPRYSVLTAGGIGNAAYDSGLAGCSNIAPAVLPFNCNRLESPASTTLFAKRNEFLSVIDPTQPVALPETTVLLQTALTFDETGNFINVIFSPLTLWETEPGPLFGSLRADYRVTSTSVARDNGRDRSTAAGTNAAIGAGKVPTADFNGDLRAAAVDIGADEFYVVPSFTVSPTALTFGNRSVNTTGTLTLTVTNTGVVPVSMIAPTLTGTNLNQFAFVNGNCPIGGSLVVGAACTINVTFTPTSNGNKSASLSVNSANVGNVSVGVSGTGVIPVYALSPLTRGFGSQQVGSVSAPFAYTVTNCAGLNNPAGSNCLAASPGNLVLTSANALVTGQFAAAAGGTCANGTSLNPGQSCTMNVTFNPTSTGIKVGSVNAPVTAGATGIGAAATGTGTAPNPAIACPSGCGLFSPTYSFGNVSVSATATFTLRNNQTLLGTTAPFVITSLSVVKTGGGAGTYTRSGGTCTAGNQLAVGGSCTIVVTFNSPTASTTTGTISVLGTGVDGIGSYSSSRNMTGN